MKAPTTLKQWLASVTASPVTSGWVISYSLEENGLHLARPPHSQYHNAACYELNSLFFSCALCPLLCGPCLFCSRDKALFCAFCVTMLESHKVA